MSLKPLARKGLGVPTAVSAGVLALGAAPAAADITSATANCPGGGDMIGPCTGASIVVETTDTNPVWVTVNGSALDGSPYTPTPAVSATGAKIYEVGVRLDCVYTPLHVIAVQKNSAGAITSQMSADYAAPSAGGLMLGNLLMGSAAGALIGGVNNGSGTTGSVGPTLSGLLSGSGTGLTKAGDLGSAAAQPCHVVSHS
ncbi:hypothetical protein [Nocardia tengchongensis]|uniref:hypothetical protein n=1 Tax=Nocardia tengchongensis TaxID=2055889 RepID=UPI001FE3B499|nr:hypothetical protein [Nocardia tengchongensis]